MFIHSNKVITFVVTAANGATTQLSFQQSAIILHDDLIFIEVMEMEILEMLSLYLLGCKS